MRILLNLLVFWAVALSASCQTGYVKTAEFEATSIPGASTQEVGTPATPFSRFTVTIMSGEAISTPMSGNLQDLIERTKEDLARRVGTVPEEIIVTKIEKTEWSDTSLGCAPPELSRRPVSIPGYRIVLSVMDQEYVYHTNSNSGVVFCPKG